MSKIKKKFIKVLQMSTEGNREASSIAFAGKNSTVNGVRPNPINPFAAFLYTSVNGKTNLIGHIGDKYLKEINTKEAIVLAIDNRDVNHPILYFSNDAIIKIDSKTPLTPECEIFLYWEYGPYSLLIFCGVDPISNKTVIECSFCNKKEDLKNNRYLFLNLLPNEQKNLIVNELNKHTSSTINDGKEVE